MRSHLLLAPLAGFAILLAVIATGLFAPAERTVRSAQVGKPLPSLALPAAVAGKPGLPTVGATGTPRLLNVFASWCVPCAAEAPQLLALRQAGVRIDGLAIRDAPADVRRFLDRYGDPYAAIGDDRQARFQLSIGSSGVPESFVIDAKGVVRHQHVGVIMPDDMPAILDAIRKAS